MYGLEFFKIRCIFWGPSIQVYNRFESTQAHPPPTILGSEFRVMIQVMILSLRTP